MKLQKLKCFRKVLYIVLPCTLYHKFILKIKKKLISNIHYSTKNLKKKIIQNIRTISKFIKDSKTSNQVFLAPMST